MSVAASIVERLLAVPPQPGHTRVLAVTGYPFTGKTTLARHVADLWPLGSSELLPTESVVASRVSRESAAVDGCHEDAHDLRLLSSYITDLATGTARQIPVYSWGLGDFSGTVTLDPPGPDGLLLIDGSVALSRELVAHCDHVVVLVPADPDTWIGEAVRRDVADRGWEQKSALQQNVQKRETVDRLLDGASPDAQQWLRVDTTCWLAEPMTCQWCGLGRRQYVDEVDRTTPPCVLAD